MQLQPESVNHLENRVETGRPFSGKCLVEAFPGEAAVAGNLAHSLDSGDVAEGFRNEGGFVSRLLESGLEIDCHCFRLRNVPSLGFLSPPARRMTISVPTFVKVTRWPGPEGILNSPIPSPTDFQSPIIGNGKRFQKIREEISKFISRPVGKTTWARYPLRSIRWSPDTNLSPHPFPR